jgi:hypothetical protein
MDLSGPVAGRISGFGCEVRSPEAVREAWTGSGRDLDPAAAGGRRRCSVSRVRPRTLLLGGIAVAVDAVTAAHGGHRVVHYWHLIT